MPRTGRLLVFAALSAALLAAPAPANAATTVGSPLTGDFSGSSHSCNPACTDANLTLPEPGANATSPLTGVIVRWRMMGNAGGAPFHLRVILPAGGGQYTGAGTSAPEIPTGAGPSQFSTRLAISTGETVGIDLPANAPWNGNSAAVSGASYVTWIPALADGPPPRFPGMPVADRESGFNADVEPDLDHDVFGDETQDKCLGTAGTSSGCPSTVTLDTLRQKGRKAKVEVTATVPGAGTIEAGSASDPALASAAKKSLRRVSQTLTSTASQQVVLTLKLTKSAKRKLADRGKLKTKVKVLYTPPGGPSGSQTGKVKLRS